MNKKEKMKIVSNCVIDHYILNQESLTVKEIAERIELSEGQIRSVIKECENLDHKEGHEEYFNKSSYSQACVRVNFYFPTRECLALIIATYKRTNQSHCMKT